MFDSKAKDRPVHAGRMTAAGDYTSHLHLRMTCSYRWSSDSDRAGLAKGAHVRAHLANQTGRRGGSVV